MDKYLTLHGQFNDIKKTNKTLREFIKKIEKESSIIEIVVTFNNHLLKDIRRIKQFNAYDWSKASEHELGLRKILLDTAEQGI